MEGHNKKTLEQRSAEVLVLLKKYPNRIPLFIDTKCEDIKLIKHKYLIEEDVTIGSLYIILRKSLNIKSSDGIYLMINKMLIPTTAQLREVYNEHKDQDCMLYISILKEETFGYILPM